MFEPGGTVRSESDLQTFDTGTLFPSDTDMKSVCKRVWLATLGDCFFFLPMRRLYLVCLQKFIAFLDLFRSLLDARTKHSSDTGTWTLNSYLPSYRECKVKGINSWGNKGRQNNFLN